MADVQATIRARAHQLLTEAAGTNPIASGHLHIHHPAWDVDTHELASVERAARVALQPRHPLDGRVNPLDGYGLYRQRMLVEVGYLLTGAGGDLAERQGEESGPGTEDAARDRFGNDQHLIEACLGLPANWSAVTDVAVIDCDPDGEEGQDPRRVGARLVCTVPFLLKYRASIPGAFAPSA